MSILNNATNSEESGASAIRIRDRVLRAIASNRVPGFHFPGHFLGIRWPTIAHDGAMLELSDDVHLRDAAGSIYMTALTVLADTAVGTAARLTLPVGARLGTVHLHLQFTGAPARGSVIADAAWRGPGAGIGAESWLGAATLLVAGKPVCYVTGDFIRLDPPPGVALAPLPWQRQKEGGAPPFDEDQLAAPERAVVHASDVALGSATPDTPFIDRFWGGDRLEHAGERAGAERRLAVGPHVSNRVGHVQGGILLGIAVATACEATPSNMSLANVSAWYFRPGRGDTLAVRSRVAHVGRTMAVARTQVTGSDGRLVLEAMTQHVVHARAA